MVSEQVTCSFFFGNPKNLGFLSSLSDSGAARPLRYSASRSPKGGSGTRTHPCRHCCSGEPSLGTSIASRIPWSCTSSKAPARSPRLYRLTTRSTFRRGLAPVRPIRTPMKKKATTDLALPRIASSTVAGEPKNLP